MADDTALIDAMARAGYRVTMERYHAKYPPAPGGPLNDPEKLDDCAIPGVKDQWIAVATAMLAETRAAARTFEPPLIEPPPPLAPVRCWLAVLKHPYREGEALFRLEYDETPRAYEGKDGKAKLIERVELPIEVDRTILVAAQWWKARLPPPAPAPTPAPEPAKDPANGGG